MTDHPHLAAGRTRLAQRWFDATREDHILLAPLVSFAAFIVIAAGSRSLLLSVTALLLQTILFQVVVTAHIRRPRLRRGIFIAAPLVVLAIFGVIGAIGLWINVDWARGLAALFSAAMAAGVIIRIFSRVARAPVVDIRVVINAVTVYLMLGLVFAYLFIAVAGFEEQFFVQGPQPNTVYLYFSYITLATIGYGDFTPAANPGRFLAVAEGLMGQLYLVTILALIVSNLGRQRRNVEDAADAAAEEKN